MTKQLNLIETLNQEPTAEIIYIREQSEKSSFFKSLLNQLNTKGFLSARQMECVRESMVKSETKIVEDTRPAKEFTLKNGETIEITNWIARKYQKELDMDFFFRNLEVVEVMHETEKAYQLKVKFVSKIASNCHVCGKALDNDISKTTGIGPSCAKKLGLGRPNINQAHLTLTALESICDNVGIIGPLWLAKQFIK